MYTEESIEVFLKEQGRLYDEPWIYILCTTFYDPQ